MIHNVAWKAHLEVERKAGALRDRQRAVADAHQRARQAVKAAPEAVPTLKEIKAKERENVENGNAQQRRELDAVVAAEAVRRQAYVKEIAAKRSPG